MRQMRTQARCSADECFWALCAAPKAAIFQHNQLVFLHAPRPVCRSLLQMIYFTQRRTFVQAARGHFLFSVIRTCLFPTNASILQKRQKATGRSDHNDFWHVCTDITHLRQRCAAISYVLLSKAYAFDVSLIA